MGLDSSFYSKDSKGNESDISDYCGRHRLHDFMYGYAKRRMTSDEFNGYELELSAKVLDDLEDVSLDGYRDTILGCWEALDNGETIWYSGSW